VPLEQVLHRLNSYPSHREIRALLRMLAGLRDEDSCQLAAGLNRSEVLLFASCLCHHVDIFRYLLQIL
jgi:hypothetical protein